MTNYQRRITDPCKNLLFLPAGMNNRGVAQLVAYYVRDVGAGSSSLLTPTNEKAWHESAGLLLFIPHGFDRIFTCCDSTWQSKYFLYSQYVK